MENQNEKLPLDNINENIDNNDNSSVLGVKRDRETIDSNSNIGEIKKKKVEEPTENKPMPIPSQQGNLMSTQQYYQANYTVYPNNPNMMNHHAPMQGVYGYPPQQQMYYYNQTAIPSGIQGHPYTNQRYQMNPYPQVNSIYPGAYNYTHSAIPPNHLYPQPPSAPVHNNYVTNYSQSVLNQTQQEKQKYIIKDYPEITVGGYLQSKNLKEQYLNSIKPKDESISVQDAINTDLSNKEINIDQVNSTDSKSASNLVDSILSNNKTNNVNNANTNNPNNIVLSSKYTQPQINSSINLNINIGTFNQIQKGNNSDLNSSNNNESKINKTNTQNIMMTPSATNKKVINTNNTQNEITILKNTNNQTMAKTNTNNNNNNKNNLTNNNDDFSQSLQEYIIRAYDKCKNDLDKKKCKKALLKIITSATMKGDLHSRDFSKFPLPVLPSEEKADTDKFIEEMNKNSLIKNNKNTFNSNNSFNNSNNYFQNKKTNEKDITFKAYNNINVNITNLSSNKTNQNSLTNNLNSLEELTKNTIIIGTCQELEKQYLRLTTIPDPSQVRPESVLKKSLKMLKEKWKLKQTDYNYFDEQFRSIRQDMTIQHIQNEFTVKVYEINARIALECHDIDQFNQCQTKLINLYESGLKGKETEFLAYRIIYMGLHKIKYDMEYLLKKLRKDSKMKNSCEISHALKTHRVLNDNNFFEFFKLYKIAPNMSSYLIEPFLPRIRVKTLEMMSIAYITEIDVDALTKRLSFDTNQDCIKFLETNNLKLNSDKTKFLCKESLPALKASDIALSKHITSNL